MELQLIEAESTRRALFNQIQELRGNVRVFARMRPPADGTASTTVKAMDSESMSAGAYTRSHFRST
jgi:kinesin family protein C1